VIVAVAEGLSNEAVAVRLGTRPATVSKWRGRFARRPPRVVAHGAPATHSGLAEAVMVPVMP
jgi:transposase